MNGSHLDLTSEVDFISGDESSQSAPQDVSQPSVLAPPPMHSSAGMASVVTSSAPPLASHPDTSMMHGAPAYPSPQPEDHTVYSPVPYMANAMYQHPMQSYGHPPVAQYQIMEPSVSAMEPHAKVFS